MNLLRRFLCLGAIVGPLPAAVTASIVNGQADDATQVIAGLQWIIDQVNANVSSGGTQSEWVAYVGVPTFISATSFSLTGDQTAIFDAKRRLKTVNTGGTIYSSVVSSVFGAVTTIVVVNDSGVLDSGLSAVNYSLLDPLHRSEPALSTVMVQFAGNNAFAASGTTYVIGAAADPWPGTATLDDFSEWDATNGKFVVKTAGRYLLWALVGYSHNSATVTQDGRLQIRKNGSAAGFNQSPRFVDNSSLAGAFAVVNQIVSLAAGDSLDIITGTPPTYSAGTPRSNNAWISLQQLR